MNERAIRAYRYLLAEGLIRMHGTGYSARLTHEGVKEINEAVKHPNQPTLHFVVRVIQHFHGPVGAVQSGSDATANVKQED